VPVYQTGTVFCAPILPLTMKKITLILLSLSLLAFVAGVAYRAGGEPKSATVVPQVKTPPISSASKTSISEVPAPAIVKTPLSPAEQQAAIDEGELISDLFDAATEGTPEKTESVYAALSHPNDAVREGALDAIIQYMGRESIPRLQAAVATARTDEEKARLNEAIEFIGLPTLSEMKAQGAIQDIPLIQKKGKAKEEAPVPIR
jgi:hypothetical protein